MTGGCLLIKDIVPSIDGVRGDPCAPLGQVDTRYSPMIGPFCVTTRTLIDNKSYGGRKLADPERLVNT